MSRYWLDAVRYGDTHGLHGDNYREMYFYRDWVIKAFNQNKPFNEFITEQLAGDLLKSPSDDQLIASGFNRLHISNSAGSALEDELYVNNVVDRVNAVGTVFLGLTLGCASCHDHKYDPISQKEYFQLFAFFNNLDGPSHNMGLKNPPPFLKLPSEEQKKAVENIESQIKDTKDSKKLKKLKAQLKKLHNQIPGTLIMKERKDKRPAFILERGQYDQPGKQVFRNTPKFLPSMKGFRLDRLGFANWLTAKNHPLTSRVTVNRIWQQFFGIGIVKTAGDFGSQGEWPSHPQLLDKLANDFIQSNWNVKALVKSIVMSKTYRQSSQTSRELYQKDPQNRLLARGPRFRMDAEMLRDQALSVSGLLVRKMYGKSVKPPQPEGLWQSVALKASNTKYFKQDSGDNIYRRSVYTFWKRALPPPAMTILNAPTRENCTVTRERTNTPLQALVLMNEPQFVEASINLGQKVGSMSGSDEKKCEWLFEKLTGRYAGKIEVKMMLESLSELKASLDNIDLADQKLSKEIKTWALLANALMSHDSFRCKE